MNALKNQTLADQLVTKISKDIFLGVFEVGASLPPLRRLSERYDVTVPTTQRAIARVEEMGLVTVRHGSGMKVLNPKTSATLSAYPYWIDALRGRPDEACELLADFLELRRELAVSLLERVAKVNTEALEPVVTAIDALGEVVEDGESHEVIARADLDVVRAILMLKPQAAFSTVFNVFERLLLAVEELQIAMYSTPARNVSGYRLALSFLGNISNEATLRGTILPILETLDRITLDAFGAELRVRTTPGQS